MRSNESSWKPEQQYTACTSLNFHKFFNASMTPTIIMLHFSKIEKSISLFIEDKLKTLSRRPLKSNKLAYSGPRIAVNLKEPKALDVIVSISQTEDSERDSHKVCKNYPHNGFSSFEKCDEYYVLKMFKKHYNGLIPFWVANTLNNVTETGYIYQIERN